MSLTLLEKAKLETDPLKRGVILTVCEESPVLERLPFMNVSSDTYKYNQTQAMPRADFRAVNEDYTEGTGKLHQVIESLTILGGDSDVDRALVKTQGNVNDLRSIHDGLKSKSVAGKFTDTFFNGDNSSNAKEFNGLQKRCTGNQLIGAATANAALSLAKLDEVIDAVRGGPNVLFMNKTMRRKVSSLVRASGAAMESVTDAFGRTLTGYAGVPIVPIEQDQNFDEILAFEEAGTGATAECTSIYAVAFGVGEKLSGLQCGDMDIIDCGLVSGNNKYRTKIDWIVGITDFHPKCIARLYGLIDA